METIYNLAIKDLKETKLKLEDEVKSLLLERDKVLSEINKQRSWVSIVNQEFKIVDAQKYSVIVQLEEMNKTLAQNRKNFVHITEKERNYLQELENSIKEKQEIKNKFVLKEHDLNNLDKSILERKKEFKKVSLEIWNLKQNINVQSNELKVNQIKLLEKERDIIEREKLLNEKEFNLDTREKKLNNLERKLLKSNK